MSAMDAVTQQCSADSGRHAEDISGRGFVYFFLRLLLIWLSWKLFVFLVGEEHTPIEQVFLPDVNLIWEEFNRWYKLQLLNVCVDILGFLGYNSELLKINSLAIHGFPSVTVGNYCLGFQLMYYFTMLIAVTKINIGKKLTGIIIGLLIVNVLNVIRISALAVIIAYYFKASWFFHDYVFNIVVFGSLMAFYYWLGDNLKVSM